MPESELSPDLIGDAIVIAIGIGQTEQGRRWIGSQLEAFVLLDNKVQ